MKSRLIVAGITAAISLSMMSAARADLIASAQVYDAHQFGVTGSARVGTAVSAYTTLPSIWASASYRIQCQEPNIGLPVPGDRAWSDNGFFGPKSIVVTSPTTYTTNIGLPGWNAVRGGTRFDCVYYYSGAAKSGLLSLGGGGTSVPIGGDSWSESGTRMFSMIKPATAGSGGCIP